MNYVLIIGIFTLIAAIEILPFYLISKYESLFKTNPSYLHLFINCSFITWSIYDLNYTTHYAHGLNSTVFILPAWPALVLFYGFGYPRIKKNFQAKIFGKTVASIYMIGCVFGLITQFKNML